MNKFGIDISHWQGDFDFVSARDNEGIEYAIIKCGGADGGLYQDSRFADNYNKLVDAGLHIGTYFYGNAFSVEEAINEARYCARILSGKSFCYPVFYDVEGNMLTGNDLTEICLAFMNELRNIGFTNVGLYSSESPLNSYVDTARLKNEGYYLWVARYSTREPHLNDGASYDLWQFGGSDNFLRSPLINGQTVDQDYCYTDFCDEHSVDSADIPDYAPVPDTTYHSGDKVAVINAIQYDNGKSFGTYYDEYEVISASGKRVVIGVGGVITAAINEDNLRLISCPHNESDNNGSAPVVTGNGKKAIVLNNITYDGQSFGVYYNMYDVIQQDGDRVVIGIGDIVTAAVNISNLEIIGEDNNDSNESSNTNGDIDVDSIVRFTGNTDYDGTNVTAWYNEYRVSDKKGDRVVLEHDGVTFAAVNVSDCELV